jgi:hypothetical protein
MTLVESSGNKGIPLRFNQEYCRMRGQFKKEIS